MAVAPGLYVLRYLSSVDSRDVPSASVRLLAGAGDVDIISAPGVPAGGLPDPGSSVVIVARRSGRVEVMVTARRGSSNLDGKFTLDLLAAARAEPRHSSEDVMDGRVAVPDRSRPSADPSLPPTLSVEAHVARRGDVRADGEGWIGGPRTPSAIEGVLFRCGGADVGVAAQYTNTLEPGRWSAWITPGSLVGTKQRRSPLTGLRLKLVGSDAAGFELSTEALFLGSPADAQRGGEVEIVTSAGLDALVGLRVDLVQRQVEVRKTGAEQPSRVRVFR